MTSYPQCRSFLNKKWGHDSSKVWLRRFIVDMKGWTVLIPPVENKNITSLKPTLKRAVIKYCPGWWSTSGFPENGHEAHLAEVLKGNPTRPLYVPSGPVRSTHVSWHISCLRTSCPHVINKLVWGMKTCGWLSPISNSLQHLRKLSVPGQEAYGQEAILFMVILGTLIKIWKVTLALEGSRLNWPVRCWGRGKGKRKKERRPREETGQEAKRAPSQNGWVL